MTAHLTVTRELTRLAANLHQGALEEDDRANLHAQVEDCLATGQEDIFTAVLASLDEEQQNTFVQHLAEQAERIRIPMPGSDDPNVQIEATLIGIPLYVHRAPEGQTTLEITPEQFAALGRALNQQAGLENLLIQGVFRPEDLDMPYTLRRAILVWLIKQVRNGARHGLFAARNSPPKTLREAPLRLLTGMIIHWGDTPPLPIPETAMQAWHIAASDILHSEKQQVSVFPPTPLHLALAVEQCRQEPAGETASCPHT